MARPLPIELRSKLRIILPVLSSEADGEALSAVRRASALLTKAGCDWFDVVDRLCSDPAPAAPVQPQASFNTPGDSPTIDSAELTRILKAIRESGVRLSANARSFCNDLECRCAAYEGNIGLSQKQFDWLLVLAQQATAAEAAS